MSTWNHYDEDFKRTLVDFYHNGKTQASLIKLKIVSIYLTMLHNLFDLESYSITKEPFDSMKNKSDDKKTKKQLGFFS